MKHCSKVKIRVAKKKTVSLIFTVINIDNKATDFFLVFKKISSFHDFFFCKNFLLVKKIVAFTFFNVLLNEARQKIRTKY